MNIFTTYSFAIFSLLLLAPIILYSSKRWYLIIPATLINLLIGAQQNDSIIVRILQALLVLFYCSLIMVMKNKRELM